jgi:hypothetical protein
MLSYEEKEEIYVDIKKKYGNIKTKKKGYFSVFKVKSINCFTKKHIYKIEEVLIMNKNVTYLATEFLIDFSLVDTAIIEPPKEQGPFMLEVTIVVDISEFKEDVDKYKSAETILAILYEHVKPILRIH